MQPENAEAITETHLQKLLRIKLWQRLQFLQAKSCVNQQQRDICKSRSKTQSISEKTTEI